MLRAEKCVLCCGSFPVVRASNLGVKHAEEKLYAV